MAKKKSEEEKQIEVTEVHYGLARFAVLGKTPLIFNSMNSKVAREILLPSKKKNATEKASSLKHDPYAEFRRTPYYLPDPKAPTLLAQLSTCFKWAISTAAIDVGGKKAQLGRLLWVTGERVPIFGIPKIFSAVARMADQKKTPDVRTRCIVPEWACIVEVSFVRPIINEQIVSGLFATAGLTQGVGDWRPQKGSGNYGQFSLVDMEDKQFLRILAEGGREAQREAMDDPEPYDDNTEELLSWFDVEVKRRGFEVVRKVVEK